MAKEIRLLTFDEFTEELLQETHPRTLIILSASQVDVQLKSILEKFFLPKSVKARDSDELLEGDNPLSTFSSKIKMARRLGLIDTALYELLEIFRDIRNKAAHWRVFGTNESPLRENFKNLDAKVAGRNSYNLTKAKYYGQNPLVDIDRFKLALLTICVLVATIEDVVEGRSLRHNAPIALD